MCLYRHIQRHTCICIYSCNTHLYTPAYVLLSNKLDISKKKVTCKSWLFHPLRACASIVYVYTECYTASYAACTITN